MAPQPHRVPPQLAGAPAIDPRSRRRSRTRGLLRLAFVIAIVALSGLSIGVAFGQSPPHPEVVVSEESVQRVLQSVAEIHVRNVESSGQVRSALGTGVVVSEDGLIVTNDHVVTLGGGQRHGRITVITADGRRAAAIIVQRVPGRDLAFLEVDLDGLVPAEFVEDMDEIERWESAFSVGAPGEFDQPVARGRVTDVLDDVAVPYRPELTTLIESSTQLQQGFSGGPLADAEGRVMGINVATLDGRGESETSGLAIPSTVVLQAAEELRPVAVH
jgi:putative serine protease PepD